MNNGEKNWADKQTKEPFTLTFTQTGNLELHLT